MPTDTKTALLDTAEAAARKSGFDGFSYADLAQSVGIRKASIHYHFPTKADLSVAMITRYHAMMQQRCAAIEAAHPDAAGRLLALVRLYREASEDGAQLCLCVALTLSHNSLSDTVRKKIAAFRAMMLDWIAAVYAMDDGTLLPVGSPETRAHTTLATLEGAHLAARAGGGEKAFDLAVGGLIARG